MIKLDRALDCLTEDAGLPSRPIHAISPAGLDAFLAALPTAQAGFLRASGFTASAGSVVLLPGADGLEGAVLGLGARADAAGGAGPDPFGALPAALPADLPWRLAPGAALDDAVLGWCMGAYRFEGLRSSAGRPVPVLVVAPTAATVARSAAGAIWLVRDLVNLPANLLGPADLADAAAAILRVRGATADIIAGDALELGYPAIAAVGRGSVRAPRVVRAHWQGSGAGADAPLVSVCGKGVCFDTGGYDLKQSSGMLRMKKDMAGAAISLGLAVMIMEADLPLRLSLHLGCVENGVTGDAMRPLDVITTRRGFRVEVGNTDAEGRLVLCDLLSEASDDAPNLLMDFATLTGAARVALGPELPALFSNDDAAASEVVAWGARVHDSVFRLPLWEGYNSWLDSAVADFNNVSEKPVAGAIIAALFLQRFVPAACRWLHFDVYGWNDRTRPGHPEGGEAQAMRAAFAAISAMFASPSGQVSPVEATGPLLASFESGSV